MAIQNITAAQATAAWQKGVQSAGTSWTNGVLRTATTFAQAAIANVNNWQQAVSSTAAANAYVKGLQNINQTAFTATVQGAGVAKYTGSATAKPQKVQAFFNAFLPQLDNIVNNLNKSNPRGPRGSAQNDTRLMAYIQQIKALRGTL